MRFRQYRCTNNVVYYSWWEFFVRVQRGCRAFLKFQNYAVINQIFISWQTENCVPTLDHTGGLNLFFWFITVASRGKKREREKERSRGRVGARKEKWKEEEENGKKRVGPRAAGLMSLIMEKYIKWHPLYFLRSISRSDSTSRPFSVFTLCDIHIFVSVSLIYHFLLILGLLIKPYPRSFPNAAKSDKERSWLFSIYVIY